MIDSDFRQWLFSNTTYSNRVVSNIVSRLNRADHMHPVRIEEVYLFELEHTDEFDDLSITVKSQIRKAVKLYFQYMKSKVVEEN